MRTTALVRVVHEVPAPYVVPVACRATHDAVLAIAQAPLFVLLSRHFQPLAPPETVNALPVYAPALETELAADHAVSAARMETHQFVHSPNERGFVVGPLCRVPLRRPVLLQHAACATLRNLEMPLDVRHDRPPAPPR